MTTTTTTQPTDSNGHPVCHWCDEAVTSDAMEDAAHFTVHEACFDAARDDSNDSFTSFDDMQCPCDDPAC